MENQKFARKCSITGEGMNTGWIWGDGALYTKYLPDTISELRKDYPEKSELSEDDLLEWAVEEEEILYCTDWEVEEDFQYEVIAGVLTEVE
jgi:hypothetical protein